MYNLRKRASSKKTEVERLLRMKWQLVYMPMSELKITLYTIQFMRPQNKHPVRSGDQGTKDRKALKSSAISKTSLLRISLPCSQLRGGCRASRGTVAAALGSCSLRAAEASSLRAIRL